MLFVEYTLPKRTPLSATIYRPGSVLTSIFFPYLSVQSSNTFVSFSLKSLSSSGSCPSCFLYGIPKPPPISTKSMSSNCSATESIDFTPSIYESPSINNEPICWFIPHILRLYFFAISFTWSTQSIFTPNFVFLPAVTTFSWCPAPTPGLNLTATLLLGLIFPYNSSCESESTLISTPFSTAYLSSVSETLFGTKNRFSGLKPASNSN